MKKVLLFMTLMSIFITSCSKNEPNFANDPYEEYQPVDTNSDLKAEFSKGLAKVLAESKEVRELIKFEALKKINYDYDVLYELVKDVPLKDGTTLEGLLSKHVSSDILTSISLKLPTLTIFVPSLPENSFSADLWNIENEIPEVAFRSFASNDIVSYDANGNEDIIESKYIPGYPIVVVKENERIVANDNSTKSIGNTILTRSSTGNSFTFLNDAFDNINPKCTNDFDDQPIATKATYSPTTAEKKIFEAFDIFPNYADWQRDHVYYNLTKTQTKGPFDLRYKEHIVGFEMLGDGRAAMNKISDHTDDPRIDGSWHKIGTGNTYIMSGWTDGEFEFEVKYCLGSSSPVGTEITTYFRVGPRELFDVKPKKSYIDSKNKFEIESITPLYVRLALPLFEWNIQHYSAVISISIAEFDLSQTEKKTISTGTKIASNFQYEAAWGTTVKSGLKWGVSGERSSTVSYGTVTQTGSDQLGTVLVNFEDQIIISKEGKSYSGRRNLRPDYNNKYYTSWYRIHIAPLLTNAN